MDASSALSDDDYDVVSNPGQRSLESSMTDFGHIPAQTVHEPPPSQVARDRFQTVSWTAADVQGFVRKALNSSSPQELSPDSNRTRRVYVDGIFDGFNASHALQLRQAKLSFPSVYLVVGIFPDETIRLHGYETSIPHVERCEVVRHCRWVDEIITEAPWTLDAQFLDQNEIDYVALDEGMSVNPACDRERLKGYDSIKALGKVIPTRRTMGLPATVSVNRPITPSAPAASSAGAEDPCPQIDIYGIGY